MGEAPSKVTMVRESTGRRSLAALASLLSAVGVCMMIAGLCNVNWSVAGAGKSLIKGSGHFGLWRYELNIQNGTGPMGHFKGDILSHEATALCNEGLYNATRAKNGFSYSLEREHEGTSAHVSWAKDSCDDMVDAVGLAKNLGCVAVILAGISAALCLVSALLTNDTKRGVQLKSIKPKICPPYSTLAIVPCLTAGILALLAVWAY